MTKYFDKSRPVEVVLVPGEYPHHFWYFVKDYYCVEIGDRGYSYKYNIDWSRLDELYSLVDKVEFDEGWGVYPLLYIRGNKKALQALEILNA